MAGFGVNVGNSVADVLKFEQWAGRELDYLGVSTGRANWNDWSSSVSWAIDNWSTLDRPLRWSIPMFATQGNLADAAAGEYNNYYLGAAQKLAAAYGDQDEIVVRVGEEFNGNWMPWAAKGKEAEFVKAFQNFVDTFRSVSDKFVFEWNVNVGDLGVNPEKCYPGDDYVDIIGMDFYYNEWLPSDPAKAWDYMVSRKYGLQWLEDFADAHGKKTGYSEWGVEYDNAGAYVKKAAEWFEDHDVVYQMYWDRNDAFQGKLSDDQYPKLADAFLDAFRESNSVIHSRVTTTLSLKATELQLTGSASINGTGNLLDNVIVGNTGDNALRGLAGDDVLQGLNGKDRLIGDAGNDVLDGSDGGDDLDGGLGNDNIMGGVGADTLSGYYGNDILDGGEGADLLDGGYGNDTMYGGVGDDIYVADAGDTLSEAVGEGADTVRTGYSLTLSANIENLEMLWNSSIKATGNELDNRIGGNTGNNIIRGLAGNDVLQGGGGNDVLDGGDGDDMLISGDGEDRLIGGNGNDTLTANGGADTLDGRAGSDTLSAGYGDDILDGGADGDVLYGGTGNDAIAGGTGNDTIYGGDGNDTVSGETGADLLFGGAGADRFVFVQMSDSQLAAPDRIMDLEAQDYIDVSAIDASTKISGNQAFVLTGGFTGSAGEVMLAYDAASGYTSLMLDRNGDKVSDVTILLGGDQTSFDHFIL